MVRKKITFNPDYAAWITLNYSRLLRMALAVTINRGYFGRVMTPRDFLHDWLLYRSKYVHSYYSAAKAPIDFFVWINMAEYYHKDFHHWERLPWTTNRTGQECDPRWIEANGTGPDDEFGPIELKHDINKYINQYASVKGKRILRKMINAVPLTLRTRKGNPPTKTRDIAKSVFYHLTKMRTEFQAFRNCDKMKEETA